jgi:hypothetical protein
MSKQKHKFVTLEGAFLDKIIYEMGVPCNIKNRYYPTFDAWCEKPVKTESFYKYHKNFMLKAGLIMVGSTQWIENCNDYYIIDEKKAALLKIKYEL